MRKKCGVILVCLFSLFFLCSCSNIRGIQLTSLISEESKKIKEQSNEIIRCLTKDDKDRFIALFAEDIRNRETFQQEVDALFSFFECDSYSDSEINTTASGGESIEAGERTKWYVRPEIVYIKTTVVPDGDYDRIMSRYYNISYYWQITDTESPTLEGVHVLYISLLNIDDTLQVGTDEFIR